MAMVDWPRLWRLFISSLPLQALAFGLLAAFLAKVLWSIAPATFTSLDWAAYDTWLRHRAPIAVSPSLAVVPRDAASEDRFGSGQWDRAFLAQLISAAHEAGASAIGVDHRLDHASPMNLGGAASDALLIEAARTAAPVVFQYDADTTLADESALFGHLSTIVDPDHLVRQVPLLLKIGATPVPAFGSLLFDLSRQGEASVAHSPFSERQAPVLVNLVGQGTATDLPAIPMSSVWNAIQQRQDGQLQSWFKGKVVVFLPQHTAQGQGLLPTGQSVNGMTLQLQLLNSLLTGNHLCAVGPLGRFMLTLLLASLIAWCLLRLHGAIGLLMAGGIVAGYGLLLVLSLPILHLVLPLTLPVTAGLFVLVGTTAWANLTAQQRMVLLERDMLRLQQDAAAVREALTLRENRAEALQEDLEAAKAAAAQSAGHQEELAKAADLLRIQMAETQTQEQSARLQLEQLERQLHDLRAAGSAADRVSDHDLELLRQECRPLGIVTQDPSLLRQFRDVKRGAKSPLTVLLLGEPGTGKELFAHAVHRLSPRAGKTFIAVNMAAISPELFESELFGHMKGSFTGAQTDRRGYFELANHGTIFLDEIGDLRPDHQSKLLRVLQERSFYRVGATVPTTIDVRIVAATNRDLQRGVSEGWFREDLYFRLNGLVFRLPPLRERRGDIPLLAETCLAEIAGHMGRPVPQIANDALRTLAEYNWPGNVREFRHALERAVALSDGPLLSKQAFNFIPTAAEQKRAGGTTVALPDAAGDQAVLASLRQHGFDMQATAKSLGWDRSTVTQRLKGLCFRALVESGGDQAKAALTVAGDPAHVRTVELKLHDYFSRLLSAIETFSTAEDALADCRRRFKNLPDRHFVAVEQLIRQQFNP